MHLSSTKYKNAVNCLFTAACPVIHMMDRIIDHAMTSHVVKRLPANSESHCHAQCILLHTCVSYNLGTRLPSGKFLCELNKADHIRYQSDLKAKPGYTYRATKVR